MKTSTHFYFDSIIVALMLVGCNHREARPLEEIGGDSFPYHLPDKELAITALCDAGDSLIVGTNRGVASFNIYDGSFRELRDLGKVKERSGDIYDIVINTAWNCILYSVKDGGVRLIGKWNDGCATALEIPDKGTYYSAYKLLPHSDYLITGTSNGVYRWIKSDSLRFDKPLVRLEKAEPMRFFSIEASEKYDFVCSGDNGVFRSQGDTLNQVNGKSVLALHDGFQLCKDGLLMLADCAADECKQEPVVGFKHSPQSFVVDRRNTDGITYVYAISYSRVEVARILSQEDGSVKGRIISTIALPEKPRSSPRNNSTRQIGLINNGYLYVAPGGSILYRLPLAPYVFSDEVISVCSSPDAHGKTMYLLTNSCDLYSMRLSGKEKPGRNQRVRYLRTFEEGGEIELLGVSGKWLIASVNGKPIGFRGYRKKISRPLEPVDDFARAGKITCNMWDDGTLFQGRDDNVRKYTYSPGNFFRVPALVAVDSVSFVKRPGDGFMGREQELDYYPEKLVTLSDLLIVGTLHNGVVYKSVTGKNEPFRALLDNSDASKILDLQTFCDAHDPSKASLFILDEEHIHRFLPNEGSFDRAGDFNLDTIDSLYHQTGSSYFNHLFPIASGEFYLFSSAYDFQKGFDLFSIQKDGTLNPKEIGQGASVSFSDAFKIGGRTYLSGADGIMRPDLTDRIALSTSRRERILAKLWPWDLILTIVGLLALFYLVFRKRLADTIRLSRIRKCFLLASSYGACKDVLKLAEETRMRTIKGHLALSDLLVQIESTVSEMKEKEIRAENQAKMEMAKDQRQKLAEDYRSGYVTALFDALVSASRLSELGSNIERFLKEKNAGKNGKDRLAILDNLGHVVNDAITVLYPAVDYRDKDKDKIDKAYETLDGIVKQYHVEYDQWDTLVQNGRKKPFFTRNDSVNGTTVKLVKKEDGPIHGVFYELYRELSKRISIEFDKYGCEFFKTFTEEDVQYKKVFNSLEYFREVPDSDDINDKSMGPHLTKRLFLIFPHCAKDYVGKYLFGETFPKNKTQWKKEKVEGEKDVVHHLPNLANEEEYGGILWVMAKAGLDAIESESKKPKTRSFKRAKEQ